MNRIAENKGATPVEQLEFVIQIGGAVGDGAPPADDPLLPSEELVDIGEYRVVERA
jgi:hypothetical protein